MNFAHVLFLHSADKFASLVSHIFIPAGLRQECGGTSVLRWTRLLRGSFVTSDVLHVVVVVGLALRGR